MAKGHTSLLFTARIHLITEALYLQQQEEAPGGAAGVSALVPWYLGPSQSASLTPENCPTNWSPPHPPPPAYLAPRYYRYLGREERLERQS